MIKYSKYIVNTLNKLYTGHPHVSIKLESSWGTEQCHHLFQKYLAKDRNHRKGFNLEMYQLIVNLYLIHQDLYGDFKQPIVIFDPNVHYNSFEE